jgi:hypothetical protein
MKTRYGFVSNSSSSSFIILKNTEWWISTCNNHPFYTIFNDISMSDYDVREFIEFEMPTYFDYFVLD